MNTTYDMAFVRRLLEIGEEYEAHSILNWRCGEKYGGGRFADPASFFVNVNDVFWWATADLEEITPENIEELERAFADCQEAGGYVGTAYGHVLFAARQRAMRPQQPAYPKDADMAGICVLFDAAGPVRDRKDEG